MKKNSCILWAKAAPPTNPLRTTAGKWGKALFVFVFRLVVGAQPPSQPPLAVPFGIRRGVSHNKGGPIDLKRRSHALGGALSARSTACFPTQGASFLARA